MKEVWKEVKGFEDYHVSNFGNVKRHKDHYGNIVDRDIAKLNKHGYYQVCLSKKCKSYYRSIHRLVAICFINNKDSKPQINHKDGDKTNNHVDNLEWCTASENIKHAIDTGLMEKQIPPIRTHEDHSMSKLNKDEVKEIRFLYKNRDNLSHRKLAEIYNVSKTNITDILNNKIWVNI